MWAAQRQWTCTVWYAVCWMSDGAGHTVRTRPGRQTERRRLRHVCVARRRRASSWRMRPQAHRKPSRRHADDLKTANTASSSLGCSPASVVRWLCRRSGKCVVRELLSFTDHAPSVTLNHSHVVNCILLRFYTRQNYESIMKIWTDFAFSFDGLSGVLDNRNISITWFRISDLKLQLIHWRTQNFNLVGTPFLPSQPSLQSLSTPTPLNLARHWNAVSRRNPAEKNDFWCTSMLKWRGKNSSNQPLWQLIMKIAAARQSFKCWHHFSPE